MHYGGMRYEHLITLVELMAAHIDRKEATISNWIVGHARLFRRFRNDGGCSLHTAVKASQWFSDHWPSDLEWPRYIPRPKPTNKEVA